MTEHSESRIHFLDPDTNAPLQGFPYEGIGHPIESPEILQILQKAEGRAVKLLSLRYAIRSDATG